MTVDVVNLASLFNVDTLLLMALATLAGIVIGALQWQFPLWYL